MRIIYVPQYPTPMRYAEWWFWKLPEEFRKAGHKVVVLGEKYVETISSVRGDLDMFSPIDAAIWLETEQIKEYMRLNITNDDVLFLADLSFPGCFCSALYHKQCPKMFAFCHATSINKFDYFESVSDSKFKVESAHADIFDKVFVGSKYHQDKLGWRNTIVTCLPYPPFKPQKDLDKKYNIISVCRQHIQKMDKDIENSIENNICKIIRKQCIEWKEYYKFLSQAKILLISSKEDTFNYTILEALMNNTIVLAPNRLCFPELLPNKFLYNNYEDLEQKINKYLKNYKNVPEIKCKKEVDSFFRNIINVMEK